MTAFIVLETGNVFVGKSFGYIDESSHDSNGVIGEVVFQTGMVGYTEFGYGS